MIWGVNIHAVYSMPVPQQIALAKTLGFAAFRVDIYDTTTQTLNYLSSLMGQGFQVMPVIIPPGSALTSESAAQSYCQTMGQQLATAFPGLTWELGNETDEFCLQGSSGDGTQISDYNASSYVLVRGAMNGLYQGLKGQDATCKTIVGITGVHFVYLQQLQSDGVLWDITGEHYYVQPDATGIQAGAASLFSSLAAFGKPIALNEFNQVNGSLNGTADSQATNVGAMMDAVSALASTYNITIAMVYELLEQPELTGGEAVFGITDSSGNPKPAALAVQNRLIKKPRHPGDHHVRSFQI